MASSTARYALYYAPGPDTQLWKFGSKLLGYDAASGEMFAPAIPDGQTADNWMLLTREPRKYGFHATLKAPFILKTGTTEDGLKEAMRHFRSENGAAVIPELAVKIIGSFIALVPVMPNPPLHMLADKVVEYFDSFRAQLTEQDRQRRLQSPLTDRQKIWLDLWGYPYVMDDFRFHMTLTGPVHADDRNILHQSLCALYAKEVDNHPVEINRLVLFKQVDAKAPFRVIDYVDLG